MSTERYDYPEDEFDVAGRDRGPQGAHRTPRPLWRTALPFLVVLIAAPLLAWGVVTMIGGGDDDPAPQATATQEPTDDEAAEEQPADEEPTEGAEEPAEGAGAEEPTEMPAPEDEAPAEPTEDEPQEPEDEQEPAAGVNYTAAISVLNGAGINGLAGQAAQALNAEGFGQVSAGNYGAAAPATTTLYYNNADLAPTAQAAAQALGIGTVVEAPSATENVDIAIVLRSDYTG